MSKFKVGDIITGVAGKYGVTNETMIKGKVIRVFDNLIDIHVIEHKEIWFQGKEYIRLDEKFFKHAVKQVKLPKGITVESLADSTVVTILNELVIAVPSGAGIGVSAVIDGEEFVEDIGKSLAFYRHQTGGMK